MDAIRNDPEQRKKSWYVSAFRMPWLPEFLMRQRNFKALADALRESYPATAQMFEGMHEEEAGHRDRLIEMFRKRFGEHIPLIRRENVKGFLRRNPTWLVRPLGVNVARKQAEVMEMEAQRFYQKAITRTTDASTRESSSTARMA